MIEPTPDRGRGSRLERVLSDLLRHSPELEAAAVVSFDGLPMASALPAGMDEDRVAAMSAALLSLGERAAEGLGRGELSQVWVEGENGTVFLVSAQNEAVLVAVAERSAKAGLVLFELRRAAVAVAQALLADEVEEELGALSVEPERPAVPTLTALRGGSDGTPLPARAPQQTPAQAHPAAAPAQAAPAHAERPGAPYGGGHPHAAQPHALHVAPPVRPAPTPPSGPTPVLPQAAVASSEGDRPSPLTAPLSEIAGAVNGVTAGWSAGPPAGAEPGPDRGPTHV